VFGLTIWGALTLTTGVLLAVGLVHRAVLREPDPFVARVVALAFAGKLAGATIRYYVLEGVYGGRGDANR
jgi:hypothetical protein